MSITSFKHRPLTFVVMYGCTDQVLKKVTHWVNQYRRSVFHPFMFPMMFLELERERLIHALRKKAPSLNERVLDMERRLNSEHVPVEPTSGENGHPNHSIMRKDCDALGAWSDVSQLKNGLEGLIPVLETALETADKEYPKSSNANPKAAPSIPDWQSKFPERTEMIQIRLEEVISELECKIRFCDSLLSGMALATQMVRLCPLSRQTTIRQWQVY